MRINATIVTLAILAAPASAQHAMPTPMPMTPHAAVCPGRATAPPAELAGWADRTPLTAATKTIQLALATLSVGRAAQATLAPSPAVTFPLSPSHPGTQGSSAGLFALPVTQAGRYRVAIGTGAWLDVVKDGRALTSIAHSHGPGCSGIRKTVDFDLAPGRYVLQVAGSPEPAAAIMVVRLPA